MGDWDEAEHPRDPHTGEFIDKPGGWVQAVSDAIGRISDERGGDLPGYYGPKSGNSGPLGLADLPADGYREPARFWAQRAEDHDPENHILGSQYEVWDPIHEAWRDGSHAYGQNQALNLFDPNQGQMGWPNLGDATFVPSAYATVRAAGSAPTGRTVDVFYEQPDPAWEYNAKGVWVPGENIQVVPTGDFPQLWMIGTNPHSRLSGTYLGVQEGTDGKVAGRPRMLPMQHFWEHARRHPNERLAAFHQAKVFPAQDLADNPQYQTGGWQILGPDGLWHTIEEVYQQYSLSEHGAEPEESIELIADGWHEPDMDTSEEITVRPRPLDW